MSLTEEELKDLAQQISASQHLPYTLRVEKVDGRKIETLSEWGNTIVYEQQDDGSYKIITE